MKKIAMVSVFLLVVLLTCSGVSAVSSSSANTDVTTNVFFGKLDIDGANYSFEPFLTRYTGVNDWGRYTFVVGTDNLKTGNYSLMQQTPTGLQLVQSYKIESSGSGNPEYSLLTLEVNKDELPVPLTISENSGASASSSPAPTPAAIEPASTSSSPATSTATSAPTPTKSPSSPLILLAAMGIAGIMVAVLKRN